jgi:hypothetical protein
MRYGKYNAIKTKWNGRTFDSKREALEARYLENQLQCGKLKKLEYQPVYELLPRPNRIKYIPDFLLTYPDGRIEAVDVKGVETPVFKLKAKMFLHFYPNIELKIVK